MTTTVRAPGCYTCGKEAQFDELPPRERVEVSAVVGACEPPPVRAGVERGGRDDLGIAAM
jgi:hypothetical protein